ncbi:hypothetical protein C8J57DRAFT_1478310 [Mycena rebaudengoi]|nr:hypothetical protein C8J57DRAFT_1478310 [Mycena rebaudengoi]
MANVHPQKIFHGDYAVFSKKVPEIYKHDWGERQNRLTNETNSEIGGVGRPHCVPWPPRQRLCRDRAAHVGTDERTAYTVVTPDEAEVALSFGHICRVYSPTNLTFEFGLAQLALHIRFFLGTIIATAPTVILTPVTPPPLQKLVSIWPPSVAAETACAKILQPEPARYAEPD